MPQAEADAFLEETEVLAARLAGLDGAALRQVTQFKNWTIEDVLVHLHFWNGALQTALEDPTRFQVLSKQLQPIVAAGGLRAHENAEVIPRGPALVEAWQARVRAMIPKWAQLDGKHRVPWIGPTMSARSALGARQMETWAHGFEVFDVLGHTRAETDRIKNIVVLGINTFPWSHIAHGLPVPKAMPFLQLMAPSGDVWTFGDTSAGRLTGTAVDFCAVVTQTRAFDDTDMALEGAIAANWMRHAQCFAGPATRPPLPGSRYRRAHSNRENTEP